MRLRSKLVWKLSAVVVAILAVAIALSGYAQGSDDTPYAFSILVNNSPCPAWKVPHSVDRVVSAIVNGK